MVGNSMNFSTTTKPINKPSVKLLVSYSDSSDSEEANDVAEVIQIRSDSEANDVAEVVQIRSDSEANDVAEVVQIRRSVSSYDSESDSESSSTSTDDTTSNEDDSDTEDSKPEKNGTTQSVESETLKKYTPNSVKKSKCADGPKRTRGELTLEDLPPLQDLHISVDKTEVQLIGHVLTIVESLVTIQSLPGVPALNLDTMLFYENGEAFGQVFDVFGRVSQPLYAVRFNSNLDIISKNILAKMPIYFAPRKDEFTEFVFADKLISMKGCDASWKHDNEPPENKLDYSDDELERNAKNKLKGKSAPDVEEDETLPTNKRPAFRANRRNKTRPSGNQQSSWKDRNETRLEVSGNGCATYQQQTFDNNLQKLPFMRPPVFNYSWQPGPENSSSQQGRFPPLPPMNFPPPVQPYYSFNFPPPVFAIKPPESHNGVPNFLVFNQMNSGGYPNMSGGYPNPFINTSNTFFMHPPPPPPLDTFSSGSPSSESLINRRVQVESTVCKPQVSNSVTNGDQISANLLPNPFRKSTESADISSVPFSSTPFTVESAIFAGSISPLESSAIPMFPPSGFLSAHGK